MRCTDDNNPGLCDVHQGGLMVSRDRCTVAKGAPPVSLQEELAEIIEMRARCDDRWEPAARAIIKRLCPENLEPCDHKNTVSRYGDCWRCGEMVNLVDYIDRDDYEKGKR